MRAASAPTPRSSPAPSTTPTQATASWWSSTSARRSWPPSSPSRSWSTPTAAAVSASPTPRWSRARSSRRSSPARAPAWRKSMPPPAAPPACPRPGTGRAEPRRPQLDRLTATSVRPRAAGGRSPIVDAACVRRWLEVAAARIETERHYLTQLDAAIGDADHGTNMHRGFIAVLARLGTLDDGVGPGQLLVQAGRTFVSIVGGAAGPLYGTAFVQAGQAPARAGP